MAPSASISDLSNRLSARQSWRCPDNTYYRAGTCWNAWDYYGRWIFMGVVVAIGIFIFFIWACINSRRRRRHGLRPMYGTGWMARGPNAPYQNNPQAYNNPNQPPPAYGAPPGQSYHMNQQYTGTTFQSHDGYYGHHQGVQAPKQAYNNQSNNDYAPPPGPPPPASRP
jgi:hypothetical protein